MIMILIIIILLYLFFYINKILSDTEINIFLKADSDNYIKNMTKYDLYARKSKNFNDYIDIINKNNNIRVLNIYNKYCLLLAVIRADIFFYFLKNNFLPDNHKIYNILWKFAFNKDTKYEDGHPHTREDIIFININIIKNIKNTSDFYDFVKLLIHEKIHIYQRYNKNKLNNILRNNGYLKKHLKSAFKLVRSNPDVDEWIYQDPNSILMMNEYTSKFPKNINDIVINGQYEHPYEMISYIIEEQYVKKY